jgi:subtilisin
MKSHLSSLVLIGSLTLGGLTTLAQEGNPGAVVPDNYIVELHPGAIPTAVAARHGLAPKFVYKTAINGFAGFVPPGILKKLQADPDVVTIAPDREVAAIGKPSGGGTARRADQLVPAGVHRIGADQVFINTADVGVAVVDTGLDTTHPDLNVSASFYSAYTTTGKDDHGHGTHVGGIIAAKNDGYDVVGVAPNATLYAVKVLNRSGSGTDSTVMDGLDWIAENYETVVPNIRVVNMSLGRPGYAGDNSTYQTALEKLDTFGITVVVAAGNDSTVEISNEVPACYPQVIAVASTTALNGKSSYRGFAGIPADTASYFTTDGAGVEISAPGEDQENVSRTGAISTVGILSTRLGGGTTRMSGTSMASPHVVGVAALIYANYPTATADDVRTKITSTASNVGTVPLNSPTFTYTFDGVREGVVSAAAALAQ